MNVYGLTGGLGMGKTTAADLLRARGVEVIDTDELARELVLPGSPALESIRRAFGATVLGPDGKLDRAELARLVFSDAEARRQLEGILHPPIRSLWRQRLETGRAAARPTAVVVIPLLFETDAAGEFDATFCIACAEATQHARLQARGWATAEIESRIAAQLPIREKMARSDFVIWNEASVELLAAQLDRTGLFLAGTRDGAPAG